MASNAFWGFLSDENDRSVDRSEDRLLDVPNFPFGCLFSYLVSYRLSLTYISIISKLVI